MHLYFNLNYFADCLFKGKGEGAELHEFKDIMRGREKLKAEHRNIVKSISKYQRHSNRVLNVVKNSGRKLREAQVSRECLNMPHLALIFFIVNSHAFFFFVLVFRNTSVE